MGLQQGVHAVHPAVAVRPADVDGRAVAVRVRLLQRRRHRRQLQGVRRAARAGLREDVPVGRLGVGQRGGARVVPQLHPAWRVRGGPDAAHVARPARRPVHRLPHHARQDGRQVVRAPHAAACRARRPARPRGQDPRPGDGPPHDARRAQLDLHRHHGHHRVEFAARRAVPAAVPRGPADGQSVPQLPAGGPHHALVQLHAGVGARAAVAGAAPAVGRVGAHARPGAGAAAGAGGGRRVRALALLPRPADGVPAVAGAGRGRAAAAAAAADGAAGAAEHAAPGARAADPVPLPGAGPGRRACGARGWHLPLHAQAAAGLRARPAQLHGLHLGPDHRRRPELSGGSGERQRAQVLSGDAAGPERGQRAPHAGGVRAGGHRGRVPGGAGGGAAGLAHLRLPRAAGRGPVRLRRARRVGVRRARPPVARARRRALGRRARPGARKAVRAAVPPARPRARRRRLRARHVRAGRARAHRPRQRARPSGGGAAGGPTPRRHVASSPCRDTRCAAVDRADIRAALHRGVPAGSRAPRRQADTVDAERSGFMSQPSSPNTRAATHDARMHTLPGGRRGKSGLPHTISEDSVHARDRDSFSSTSSQSLKKPIVSTQFVEWATAQFARGEGGESGVAGCTCSRAAPAQAPPSAAPPASGPAPSSPLDDCESAAYHERLWRKARNASIRKEARALRGCRAPRLETQAFHSRCPLPPAVVLFHPYEQHAAVASKDNFGVWDWGTAAKLCVGRWERAWGRITSLAYLNAHARALLAVASHAGNVAVYRPGSSGTEPALVGAWRALDVRPAPEYRPPPAQPIYSLAQLVTEQWSTGDEKQVNKNKSADSKSGAMSAYSPPPPATLVRWGARAGVLALGGAAPALRLWDARAELLLRDVPTGSDAPVTALWLGGDTALAGFGDGAVRAWDARAPRPLFALPPLAARVLCAAPRPDLHALVAGGVDGEVRIYDTRKLSSPVHTVRAPAPLAALDVHPRADLLACGSVNQCISIYDLRGSHLNTIKFHEGFMGARIGPVSCLAFHPLRCALGVGAKDATVSVYVAEARR
ncbi:uncharacterized protein LOC121732708 isoform X2 [Aricia agestis]|uniref:uncharacterized protein LOC121732708 isoform X2 n=1 Tax=Aricia agestis TaxID=91739 RepID=UPI001C206B8E|nr:uncharacterized protein LOC121732708 isoform X2 [Aricia agestis]